MNEYKIRCERDGYIHSVTTLYKASTRCCVLDDPGIVLFCSRMNAERLDILPSQPTYTYTLLVKGQ